MKLRMKVIHLISSTELFPEKFWEGLLLMQEMKEDMSIDSDSLDVGGRRVA